MPQWPFIFESRDRCWYLDGDGDGTVQGSGTNQHLGSSSTILNVHRHKTIRLEKQLSPYSPARELVARPHNNNFFTPATMLKQPITCKIDSNNLLGLTEAAPRCGESGPSSLYSFHSPAYE